MDWMNEMGEMVSLDAPEREDAYEAMVDTATALLIEEQNLWGAEMAEEIGALLRK